MNELQSTFLILSASFSSTSCCFSSGMALKIVAFSLRLCVICVKVAVFIHEKEKLGSGVSSLLSHHFPPCFDHVLQCIMSGVHCFMYHDQDTFDFSQGHVTKNQPMAVPI